MQDTQYQINRLERECSSSIYAICVDLARLQTQLDRLGRRLDAIASALSDRVGNLEDQP